MAYSDYGSYCFIRKPGEQWTRFPLGEDISLVQYRAGAQVTSTPMLEATGLKFDALLNGLTAEQYSKNEYDFATQHAHHAVIGDQAVTITVFKGYSIRVWVGNEETRLPDAYGAPAMGFGNPLDGYEWKVITEVNDAQWAAVYLKGPECEWLTLCGYGLGEGHFWQDEEGFRLEFDYKDLEKPPVKTDDQWPREQASLALAIKELGL